MPQVYQTTPFRHFGTVTRTVSSSSASVALSRAIEAQTCIITAPSANTETAFIAFGTSAVTAAAATGFPILPGTAQAFCLSLTETHVAAIMVAGTGSIFASVGDGV